MKMKVVEPGPAHQAFRNDMVETMRKHQHLPPDQMLAIAAYFVGQLVALQDQRKMTPQMALAVVSENIEAGNAQAMKEVASAGGVGN